MQAFLITAYKDEPHLRNLVRFCSGFAKVFVHIDRKSPISVAAVEEEGGVALKRYRVGWGAYAHLAAIVDLLRLAVNDPAVDYVHVISGQDIPLHPAEWFVSRYSGCEEIQAHVVSATRPGVNRHWYEHCWPSTLFGLDKRGKWVRRLDDLSEAVQTRLRLSFAGLGGFETPYKSLVYVSLPVSAAACVLMQYEGSLRLRLALRRCFIAEEFFFMTVLMNSPFARQVTGRDTRYCDWSERNGAYPAYLDAGDFDRIFDGTGETGYVFARKVDSRVSAELVRRIWEKCGGSPNVRRVF